MGYRSQKSIAVSRDMGPLSSWMPLLSGPKRTMTARDVTGFYALFSAWKSGHFLHILGDRFLTNSHRKPGERAKNPMEKIHKKKKNPVETAPRN